MWTTAAALAGDRVVDELMIAIKSQSRGQITHAHYHFGELYRRSMSGMLARLMRTYPGLAGVVGHRITCRRSPNNVS